MDIEEDIKILKNLKKYLNLLIYEGTHKIIYNDLGWDEKTIDCINAIEHILAEREADKKKIKELETKQKAMCEEYCPKTERIKELEEENRIFALEGSRVALKLHIEENYIPKQKVEESYLNMEKEYARKVYDDNYNRNEVKKEEFYKRQVYEELLEDK